MTHQNQSALGPWLFAADLDSAGRLHGPRMAAGITAMESARR
jgi:hypothetical protein